MFNIKNIIRMELKKINYSHILITKKINYLSKTNKKNYKTSIAQVI